MRKFYLVLLAIVLLASSTPLSAKGFVPPTEGKAVVYFARVTSWGGSISFEFFHQDKYIGVFKKKNYIRYECEPGEQLFWASSENKEFVTADLKAGETYIVIVDVIMGAWKARVGLDPIGNNGDTVEEIDQENEELNRAIELIKDNDPVITSEEKIEKMNIKLKDFIVEKLDTYNTIWKLEKNFKHISAEMAIPADKLN